VARVLRLVCLACLSLVVPASAAAAPRWGEAPPVELGVGEIATCLRDVGGGRVAALADRDGRFGAAFYAVEANGLRADGEAVLGRRLLGCPAVAASGSGAAVAAVGVRRGSRNRLSPARLVVRVRDAGHGFSPPVELARASDPAAVIEPAVAVGADGSVLVAWQERLLALGRVERVTVRVARRPAGGARFGPVATLVDRPRVGQLEPVPLAVALDAAGSATVAFARPRPARREGGGTVEGLASIEVAIAPPGGAFGRTQRVVESAQYVSTVVLASDPAGRALLAHDGDEGVRVYERSHRAGAFAPGPTAGGSPDASAARPAVALAADGGAVVAWRAGDAVDAIARSGPGGFGPVQRIQAGRDADSFEFGALVLSDDGPPLDEDDGRLRAAAAPGGRGAVGWLAPRDPLRGPGAARVAPATGERFAPAVVLGFPARDVEGVVPWLGTGGRAAVWAENRTRALGTIMYPVGDGRLRLARAGRPPAQPAAPVVRVAAPPPEQALHRGSPLRLEARCSATCDLRATIAPRGGRRDGRSPGAAIGTAGRTGPGSVRLRLDPLSGDHIAPPGGGTVPVTVLASAPGGVATARTVVRARVRRRPVPPFRRPLQVQARRADDAVVVTWRTAGPARRMSFFAFTRRTRGRRFTLRSSSAARRGRGDQRFRLRLRDARDARWVVLLAAAQDPPRRSARVVVPVR